MESLREAAAEFLAQRRLAVVGVSRDSAQPANFIYRRLRDAGYRVFAVNPNAERVEGDPCHPSVASIAEGVDAVVVVTPSAATADVVRDCAAAGVRRVWLHRSFGTGSVSAEAVELCRQHGIAVLDGACPMMFLEPVDLGHRCMRWLLRVRDRLPGSDAYRPDEGPEARREAGAGG